MITTIKALLENAKTKPANINDDIWHKLIEMNQEQHVDLETAKQYYSQTNHYQLQRNLAAFINKANRDQN